MFLLTGTKLNMEYALHTWHGNRKHYDYDSMRCKPGKNCGGYTQVQYLV